MHDSHSTMACCLHLFRQIMPKFVNAFGDLLGFALLLLPDSCSFHVSACPQLGGQWTHPGKWEQTAVRWCRQWLAFLQCHNNARKIITAIVRKLSCLDIGDFHFVAVRGFHVWNKLRFYRYELFRCLHHVGQPKTANGNTPIKTDRTVPQATGD